MGRTDRERDYDALSDHWCFSKASADDVREDILRTVGVDVGPEEDGDRLSVLTDPQVRALREALAGEATRA